MAKYSKTTSNKNGSVTYETGNGNHVCEQREVLNRINLLLFGNGKIEDGMAFQFRQFMKDHKAVVDNIEEIRSKVTEAIDSSGKAVRAIEIYKTEVKSFEEGEGSVLQKQKADSIESHQKSMAIWQKWIWIIMVFLGLCGLSASIYFSALGNEKSNIIIEKQDEQGVPVVTRNGAILPLPDSTQIKFYPKDFTGDSTKTK